MSDNKQYFSLAIEKESRDTLNMVTKAYGLTQSEIVEALMTVIKNNPASAMLNDAFVQKKEQKKERRKAVVTERTQLRKALSKMSENELKQILADKGLL